MHTQPHPKIIVPTMLSFAFQLSSPVTIISPNYLQHRHLPIHPHLRPHPTYLYRNLILQVISVVQVVILVWLIEYPHRHEFTV